MKKGESFELEVKELLEAALYHGELGLSSKCARVFHRKPYYSRDRNSQITFDVSLELRRQKADEPYLIWIWECKDYRKAVPVDDIEEFHAKLEQIGVHKTKGTVACRNGFQKSAVEIAKAKGIGLVRLLPDGSVIRLLESIAPITSEDVERILADPNPEKLGSMFYGISSSQQAVTDFAVFVLLELDYLKQLSADSHGENLNRFAKIARKMLRFHGPQTESQ